MHIRRMREYQQTLETYGLTVEMLRTERPGYIVYEDEHQVVAYPFADTPCWTSSVDGSRVARGDLRFWQFGRVQSSVRPC